ncbi:MAG TPA: adenosylcobinamide-GDP ribazoletransferase [Verrucomicrobiae bacterium]|nr:adenosylcobinamide-GDP ribazoletransferase [Verrucomicrobiae bacterium]
MVIKSILEILSFLTIIPVEKISKENSLENISINMHLFPIIGLIIGISSIPITIFSFLIFNHLISGFIITIFLIIITGIHHTDALADFADGIMVKGSKEKKYKIIHDPAIGAAGVLAMISYFIGMTITISTYTDLFRLITSLLISEIIAKYVMVLQAYCSNSAWEGYSSLFTKNMKSKKKIIASTIITIILLILSRGEIIPIILFELFIVGAVVGFIIIFISNRNFGGITGDVMGATNEIVRLCSMIIIQAK